MAEAITRQMAGSNITARSAGSQPEGRVHAGALSAMERAGYNTDNLHSKSWSTMRDFEPDLIITLCDSAAGENCPVWFDSCRKLHWGLEDPSVVQGDAATVSAAFAAAIGELEGLVGGLLGSGS